MSSPLGSKDAVVINEGDREAAKSNSRWQSLKTFHKAPCLAPSVGIGAAGGLGIGGLRYVSGSGGRAAFTWGSVVAGLLAGTSWFTCRRQMYSKQQENVNLLQRVAAGDPDAMAEYQAKLEERSYAARGPKP